MTPRKLAQDELDRLLRAAFPDDLPAELERDLRREARRAWHTAASQPRRTRWRIQLALSLAWRASLPQPVLVAVSILMLAAGQAMQAAPVPSAVVSLLEGRQAAALTARALERASEMQCSVEAAGAGAHVRRYWIEWAAPGRARVRFDGEAGPVERRLSLRQAGSSVLLPAGSPGELAPELDPVRDYLSPAALSGRLAAAWRPVSRGETTPPGRHAFLVGARAGDSRLRVTIDDSTRLPLRLEGEVRDGRVPVATCYWP